MAVSNSIYTCRPNKHNKLENVANLNVLFLTMWLSCCLSHNKGIRTQLLSVGIDT